MRPLNNNLATLLEWVSVLRINIPALPFEIKMSKITLASFFFLFFGKFHLHTQFCLFSFHISWCFTKTISDQLKVTKCTMGAGSGTPLSPSRVKLQCHVQLVPTAGLSSEVPQWRLRIHRTTLCSALENPVTSCGFNEVTVHCVSSW